MPYKIERWSQDLLAPPTALKERLRPLSDRELVIVSSALIDAALAELLSARLLGSEAEIEEFLGTNNDSRAPAATFGARILLARLTGMLEPEDVLVLRRLKDLRNEAAHRVKPTFQARGKSFVALHEAWSVRARALGGRVQTPAAFATALKTSSTPARDLVFQVTVYYQRFFELMHGRYEAISMASFTHLPDT